MRTLAFGLMFVLGLVATAQGTWANFERYAEANKAVPQPQPGENRVVFIGNSITDGWVMHHPQFFAENNYIDRGISGQVTSQILLRFREDVLNLKPALVVIAGGTNDAAEAAGPFDPIKTLGNFKTMVELARSHGIKVIIGSLLPCATFTWGTCPPDAPATIEDMNRRLREYADSECIPFADYYTPMVRGKEKALNPDWTWDNIHPNLEGYKVMESVIQPLIEKELGIMNGGKQRSLDEVDRDSYGAVYSPVQLEGIEMQKVKSVKTHQAPRVLKLSGQWSLAEGEQPGAEWLPAHVPGSVHAAMFENGKIPDPTIGKNDLIAERESYKHWWYKREFDYDGKMDNPRLIFDGVANKCTVYLNGHELGEHEGMLSGFSFDVDTLLRKGHNELLVHLDPIPDTGPARHNGSWIHTVVANCVYGWHYVQVPTLGLWRDVSIEARPDKEIGKPFVFTRSTDGQMRLSVNLPQTGDKGRISLQVKPKNFEGKTQAFTVNVGGCKGETALDFKLDNPRLWWPNGYGEQPLYTATVIYDSGDGATDVKTVNFGVRTIEMRPVGGTPREDLYNWQFVVNGKPIFVKGTNWCLMDFMMDLSPERYGRFLGAAKEQNLNMLRAWGGGLVETDLFYDICDEMGLMVLQEWPTGWNSHNYQNPDVLRETVDYNTLRIRSHPSLVMWAGGNESDKPFGEMIDYMGRKSIEMDGTRPFHRGEPWGGSWHNHDSWWLDLHLNNALNMTSLFFGEFGMPSLPCRETVDRYLNGEEYSYPLKEGTVFEHHGPVFGTREDMRLLLRASGWFTDPTTLDNMILGSQLAQTMGTRRALERARTLWPDQSGGAVYYKINDVFPGLSWGSVDYYGAKKLTHYFVKRSAEPCMPVILFNQTNLTGLPARLSYYVLDDTLSLAGRQVVATVSVYDRLMKKLYQRADTLTPQNSVNRLSDICLDKVQTTTPLLYFKTDLRDVAGKLIARNWYIENFDSKQNAIFDAPKAQIDVQQEGNVVKISNQSAEVPAVAVVVEVPGEAYTLTLSDNVLWIDPGETLTVEMNTAKPVKVSAWNVE